MSKSVVKAVGKVIIKPQAYLKILVHALRWGSTAMPREQYKECMGMLIGKNQGNDVIVESMVPINHGGSIEVNFSPNDYVAFSMVDGQFAEQGLFTVGWFHSHPGLELFLSSVDVRNHLGWQTQNPLAIALVFDHMHLQVEGDLGFKIFRLNNVGSGALSDFHEVPWVLEPPSDPNLYKDGIKQLIDNLHGKLPVILEINEVPDVFGDLKIPGANTLRSKIPELDASAILESFKKGISDLAEEFFAPLARFLVSWSQEISSKVVDGNVKILQTLVALRDAMNKGMQQIVNWFKYQVGEKLNNVDVFIDDRFESLTTKTATAMEGLKQLPTQLKGAIDKIITETVDAQIAALKSKINESLGNIDKILASLAEVQKNVQTQEQGLGNIVSDVTAKKDAIGKQLDAGEKALLDLVKDKIKKPVDTLAEVKREEADLASSLKAFSAVLAGIKTDVQKLKGGK
jgi:proteasome lid subunit RPN8/RPN11